MKNKLYQNISRNMITLLNKLNEHAISLQIYLLGLNAKREFVQEKVLCYFAITVLILNFVKWQPSSHNVFNIVKEFSLSWTWRQGKSLLCSSIYSPYYKFGFQNIANYKFTFETWPLKFIHIDFVEARNLARSTIAIY